MDMLGDAQNNARNALADAEQIRAEASDDENEEDDNDDEQPMVISHQRTIAMLQQANMMRTRRTELEYHFEKLIFIDVSNMAENSRHYDHMKEYMEEKIFDANATPPAKRARYKILGSANAYNRETVALTIHKSTLLSWRSLIAGPNGQFEAAILSAIDSDPLIRTEEERERIRRFAMSQDGRLSFPDRPLVHHLCQKLNYQDHAQLAIDIAISFLRCDYPPDWTKFRGFNFSDEVLEKFSAMNNGRSLAEIEQIYFEITGNRLRTVWDVCMGMTWGEFRRKFPFLAWLICSCGRHSAPPQCGGRLPEAIEAEGGLIRNIIETQSVPRAFHWPLDSTHPPFDIYHFDDCPFHLASERQRYKGDFVCSCPYTKIQHESQMEATEDLAATVVKLKKMLRQNKLSASERKYIKTLLKTHKGSDIIWDPETKLSCIKAGKETVYIRPTIKTADGEEHHFLKAPFEHHKATLPEKYKWKDQQCSHQCQDDRCMTVPHVCAETAGANTGRNGCPGPPGCRHVPRCYCAEGTQLHGRTETPAMQIVHEETIGKEHGTVDNGWMYIPGKSVVVPKLAKLVAKGYVIWTGSLLLVMMSCKQSVMECIEGDHYPTLRSLYDALKTKWELVSERQYYHGTKLVRRTFRPKERIVTDRGKKSASATQSVEAAVMTANLQEMDNYIVHLSFVLEDVGSDGSDGHKSDRDVRDERKSKKDGLDGRSAGKSNSAGNDGSKSSSADYDERSGGKSEKDGLDGRKSDSAGSIGRQSNTADPGRRSVLQCNLCLHSPTTDDGKASIPTELMPSHCAESGEMGGTVEVNRKSVPFLTSQLFWHNHVEDKGDAKQRRTTMHISHLCHNSKCYNFMHTCQEWIARNVGRNGCPALDLCRHDPKCIACGSCAFI